jgi:hypothetical protein
MTKIITEIRLTIEMELPEREDAEDVGLYRRMFDELYYPIMDNVQGIEGVSYVYWDESYTAEAE